MELNLQSNIGPYKLGITRDEMREACGEPDKVSSLEEGDESWAYNSDRITVDFHKDSDFRSAVLSSSNPTITFRGHQVIGMAAEDLIDQFEQAGLDDWEEDEDELSTITDYMNDEANIEMSAEYGFITVVEIYA